jgi:carboxyl-terminal processing protease
MPRIALRRPRGFFALSAIAALTAALVGAQAPSFQPSDLQQLTARYVALLLERGHMSHPTINDEVAKRWAKNFIESLDPLKYNFLKADVDEFMAQATTLDDKLKDKGDISWASQVFDRYLTRSDERLATILDLLKEKPDFTSDETMVDDPKRLDYPATADEARDRLHKIVKLEELRAKVSKTDDSEAETVKRLTVRYKDLNRYYHQFNSNDLLERYLTALTMAIDPHSAYWQASTLEDMLGQTLHLSLEGIGASLQSEDGYPTVKEVVPGGAADKDGRLQPEDKIVGLENEDGTKEDFIGKKLSDVVRKIRGPAGTHVKLLVQPADSKDIKSYELVRQKIELKEQKAKGQVIEAKGSESSKPVKVGVISLPSFYGDTLAVMNGDPDAVSATRDCKRLLEDFKKQGVDIVVVDLRGDGGGLLQEAVTLSGLFIDTGPVVQVKEASGTKHHDDEDAGTSWDGPMAVLIDHTSASASEIFAGVIKDYGRGLIIGDDHTYGKGTVQSIIKLNEQLALRGGKALPDLGALKLTIQQFYRANGESTQLDGVKSDIHIPSFLDQQEIGEGTSDTALKSDKIAPLPHDNYRRVPKDLVATLTKRSEERREADPKFKEQVAALERFAERKKRHEISLNEDKFKAEMASNENDDEDAKPKDKTHKRHAERQAWESNFYNDEVMRILADYVQLGGKILTAGPVHPGDQARPALP